MTFLRNMKQTLTNGVEDITKLAKLKIEDETQQVKHEIRQDQMENTLDDLHDGYEKLKETIKDTLQ